MAQYVNMYHVELANGTAAIENIRPTYQGNANANRIGAIVTENGVDKTLGGRCAGLCVRADGNAVPLTGTVTGNQAYVTLDGNCYEVPGQIIVFVTWVASSSAPAPESIADTAEETTLLCVYGNVVATSSGSIIQPVEHLPDYAQLLSAIEDMEDATDTATTAITSAFTNIAPTEASTTASRAYTAGDHFFLGGVLYEATADIAQGGTIVTSGTGKNCKTAVLGAEVSDLKSALDYPYGALPANTDIDTIGTNGIWWISQSNTYTNLPTGMANGVLISRLPISGSTNVRMQIAYSNDNSHLYHRYRVSRGWGNWQKDALVSDIADVKNALDYPYGALPANTDINTIDANGIWWISAQNTYTHLPTGMTNGVLISRLPISGSTNVRIQIAYSNDNLHLYHRYRVSSGWGAWKKDAISDDLDAIVSEINALSPYGVIHTQTSTSRTMTVAKSIAQGERISIKIKNWTGPTPSAINLYLTDDGSTYTIKVTVYKVEQWLDFVADQAYTGYRVGMKTASLSEAATLEIMETPYHQPEYITEPVTGAAPIVYGKKILLGGASIVAGYGGTGYAMDGDIIIDISNTPEGQAYSSGGIWKRNTSGYCWANLFKTLVEGQYNATIVNNGCAGVDIGFWARHAETLIPDDGYDMMIYSFSSNDRNAVPATVKSNIKNGLKTVLERCQELGIELIVFSVPPASLANENTKSTKTWQCNEFIKSACAELSIQYFDLHDALIKYYWDHGAASAGTYISDGLHPNDAMYYVMYFQYLWLLNVSPMTAYQQPPA